MCWSIGPSLWWRGGVRRAVLTEQNAEALVDDLLRAGGRFPFRAGEFIKWAQEEGLLLPTG